MKSGLILLGSLLLGFFASAAFCAAPSLPVPDKLEPVASSCNDCTGKPVAPLTVKIEVGPDLSLTEPFTVRATIVSASGWKDASLLIDAGDGLVISSGVLHWNGPLKANIPAQVSVLVSFIGSNRVTVTATGGLNFKNGTKLFKATEKVIDPPGVLLKSVSSIKTITSQILPGVIEVMGVER